MKKDKPEGKEHGGEESSPEKKDLSDEDRLEVQKAENRGRFFLMVQGLAALAAVGLIVALLFGISSSEPSAPPPAIDESERNVFNGYEFEQSEGVWVTKWAREGQVYNLWFRFRPEDVTDVPVEGRTDERFQSRSTYVTFDAVPGRSAENAFLATAAFDVSNKFVSVFGRNVTAACTANETEACASRPIVTCGSTNSSVVYVRISPETKVIRDGNCVTLQGSGENLSRAVDRALYEWLRII